MIIVRKYNNKSWFSINRCFKLLVMTGNFNVLKRERVTIYLYNLEKVGGVLSMKKEQKYHQNTFCVSQV